MEQKCLFPEKEKAIKMIEKTKEKVGKCDSISVEMLDKITEYLDDILSSGGKICYVHYRTLRHQAKTLATKFSNNCSCTKSKR